ncbi:MAG: glycosyltransferase family 2 protein [Elusimicrobia bacterium]|nr:glycosyltransferase family 2 protein [Elusimicrobiota bacterium]
MFSVVVAVYNGSSVIERCLGSLLAQECREGLEIIVVDNGSSDGTPGIVRERFPRVRLLEKGGNLGAAAARNLGISASRGEWVFTFDCDTAAGKGFFSAVECLIDAAEGPRAGVIQPLILDAEGREVFSCGIALDFFWRFNDIDRGERCGKRRNNPARIDAACSACAGYRRRMLEEIKDGYGYFDERFFFMVEDVDLGVRAKAAGWTTAFCPGATAYHSGNSSAFSCLERQYFCWRNRKFMLKKMKKPLLRACAAALCYDLPRDAGLFFSNYYMRRAVLSGRYDNPLCDIFANRKAKCLLV